MHSSSFVASFVLLGASLVSATPIYRRVTLDPSAVAEAQVRDNTATRAFSSVPIKTASGQCLFVDPNSGDFRENLTPVQTAACDGSAAQQWDVITAGKHINAKGAALFVSSLTQACLNFDPRRAAGNQVLLFSCGGRADGGGLATDSQAFTFSGGASPLALAPLNGNNAVCLTVVNGALDQTACNPATASGNELFTIGNASGAAPAPPKAAPASSSSSSSVAAAGPTSTPGLVSPSTTTPAAAAGGVISVSRAGGVLNPTAVAEYQVRDNTATRAFSGAQVKTSDGQCLSVDANAGDFRENLIPVQVKACDGSAGQKFDVITAGVHINVKNAALFVSSLTQGCLNFDPRRAAGDQVLLFSCGGRADGGGAATDSQFFNFAGGAGPLPLVPQNSKNTTCLVNDNGVLGPSNCDPAKAAGTQLFTIA